MAGKRAGRWLQAAAVVGIGGWMLILATYLYWLLAPVTLPDVATPIPI